MVKEHFVEKNGKEGLISRDGKTVIPPIYDKIYVDNGTLIKVKLNGVYGTINWKNKLYIRFNMNKFYGNGHTLQEEPSILFM